MPTKPYNTNSLKTIGIFTFGALLVTVLFIFVVTYFSNTVKDEEELERLLNLRVIAIIPKIEE